VRLGIGGPWAPIGRLAALPRLWGGQGRWRKLAAGRNWAIFIVVRDNRIDPGEGRKAGE
jgi:hypothetical protein